MLKNTYWGMVWKVNRVGVGTAGGRQATGKVGAARGLEEAGGMKEDVRRDISMEPLTRRKRLVRGGGGLELWGLRGWMGCSRWEGT